MTTGTLDFLEKIADKHDQLTFFFMTRNKSTLVYYEGGNKDVFAAGQPYDILIQRVNIAENGYVVMNHIPVTEEGRPVFENRLKKRENQIGQLAGLQAFRLLKPTKDNTYMILTQWQSEGDYEAWRETEDYQKSLENQAVKRPAYFASRPYKTTYHMYVEEDEDSEEND